MKNIFINTKSINHPIANHLRLANPDFVIKTITKNTQVTDPEYHLISINPKDHFKQKKSKIALLHRTAKWNVDINGRSTDFLPSQMIGQGCFKFGCSYCYTERHYTNNFLKIYDDCYNVVDLCQYIVDNEKELEQRFYAENKKMFEKNRDSKHPKAITIDLGCDEDCVTSNQTTMYKDFCGHIIDIMNKCEDVNGIMTSFATKSAEIDPFINYVKDPSKHRIRLSLMPEHHRTILEMNTSKIDDRLSAINKLVDAGFEVHINLSPIVVTELFAAEYADLLKKINDSLSDKAKKQMAYEIIFLTHSVCVYDKVNSYAPKAQNMMVNGPLKLEPKWNKPNVLSYSRKDKTMLKQIMNGLINEFTPYSRIRYMF